ncbi:uroporphyrinogen decarboxylase family protein [Actinomycetota bacterium]
MTPRQRVLAAIDHKEPDKIPIDLGGTICTTISATANKKLKKFMKIDKDGELITHPLLDVVLPLPEILDQFETDCRTVRLKAPTGDDDDGQPKGGYVQMSLSDKPQGHGMPDEFGTTWKKCGYDYSPVTYPLHDADLSDLKDYPWPDPYNAGRTVGMRKEAEELRKTDYAILSDIMCGGPYENALWVRGFDQFPMDLMSDEKMARAILDKITDLDIGFWDAQLSAVGDLVDVVCQGDDMGMQTGMQISPEIYRKFIKPCHKRLFSFIRSKTDARIWLHSCGSVYDIIPDLIEIGIQVLNPVQCSAKNMELPKLKKEYGADIAFWGGGFNVQKIPFMTQDEIRESVRETMYTMAPGGGYIFAGTHNILPETEGESIHTAFMAAKEYREYSKLV